MSALTLNKTTLYSKYEWVQKSADDLLLSASFDHHRLFNVNAATLGIQQTIATELNTHMAIGAQASWYPAARGLSTNYGQNPIAAQVYIRIFPNVMNMH